MNLVARPSQRCGVSPHQYYLLQELQKHSIFNMQISKGATRVFRSLPKKLPSGLPRGLPRSLPKVPPRPLGRDLRELCPGWRTDSPTSSPTNIPSSNSLPSRSSLSGSLPLSLFAADYSTPRVFPSQGFKPIVGDEKIEEEEYYDATNNRYLPVEIGDIYNEWQVQCKLGYGKSSTVWLAKHIEYGLRFE